MKKLLTIVLIIAMLIPAACAEIDLTGMSYDELIALKDKINLALWETKEWQEVLVLQGTYIVGVDIPAGQWTIKAAPVQLSATICHGNVLNEKGNVEIGSGSGWFCKEVTSKDSVLFNEYNDTDSLDVVLIDGYYLTVTYASVIFTTYDGRPDLGFKK